MSLLDDYRARHRELTPELQRLASLPGKLSGPQRARWDQLLGEEADLAEKIADLEGRQALADRAKPLVLDDMPSRRDLARDAVIRNIEAREVRCDDYIKNSIISAVDH